LSDRWSRGTERKNLCPIVGAGQDINVMSVNAAAE